LLDGKKSNLADAIAVKVKSGDLYLGLDLAAHLLPLHKTELAHWKRQGVLIHVIVYDLLPVLHPHWFNPKTTRNFHRWLKVIASLADSVICISNTVKAELEGWLSHQYALSVGTIPVHTISLGADLQSSIPSCGLPDDIEQLLNKFSNQTTVLMVGTLEPRKGHDQVLLAFDELWKQGCDVNLIIVGKPGWKTDCLQQKLRSHPQLNSHLHWFDKASDEFLELLYRSCSGVIVASYAEGYGLPLIEAMYHNKPVLARDIPVFREIGGSCVSFGDDLFCPAKITNQE
jgi:glycosyltransferase involved in cell wall biosynthesis